MKIRDLAKKLVTEFNANDGAAVVPFVEGRDWQHLENTENPLCFTKGNELPEKMVRSYLWEVRQEVEKIKVIGGVWASRHDDFVTIGLCVLKEASDG